MDDNDDHQVFLSSNDGRFQMVYKRLKKSALNQVDFHEPTDEYIMAESENFPKPVDNFTSPKAIDTEEIDEPSQILAWEDAIPPTNSSNSLANGSNLAGSRATVKRMLQFDSLVDESVERVDVPRKEKMEEISALKTKKSRSSKGSEHERKSSKKRAKGNSEDKREKSPRVNKRRVEKERTACLQQLHAESQRLLRETHNASFKPTPVVHKPISSVLEKLRRRKFELSKKSVSGNGNLENAETSQSSMEVHGFDSQKGEIKEPPMDEIYMKGDLHDSQARKSDETENHETCESQGDSQKEEKKEARMERICMESDVHVTQARESNEFTPQSIEDASSKMGLDVASKLSLSVPLVDPEMYDANDRQFSEEHDSPQEVLAPSRLAMNLRHDCAVDNSHDDEYDDDDDCGSDEYDDDKENIAPVHGRQSYSSHVGDPVKAFVDDEAEEEEDSDNDPFGYEDSEEEDKVDAEELADLIETGYVEKPIDNERRNQLHQQWLEQQDAAGTEDLLQRLKCGHEPRDTTLYEYDRGEEDSLSGDSSGNEAENMVKRDTSRRNSLKIKQMIQQPFNEKDDLFLSDDEEAEEKLEKQRVLEKIEETSFFSPIEDENSREVFGLIKKLNIVPDPKKKAKPLSFFDTILSGSTSNSTKSSFLGRSSSFSISSSSRKQSSTVRSFVFGRDDSNSKDAISASEDSTDMIEKRPVRQGGSAKFHSSQSRSILQKGNTSDSNSSASLLDVLRRSSIQSLDSNASLSEDMFLAFKSTRNSVKINRNRG